MEESNQRWNSAEDTEVSNCRHVKNSQQIAKQESMEQKRPSQASFTLLVPFQGEEKQKQPN